MKTCKPIEADTQAKMDYEFFSINCHIVRRLKISDPKYRNTGKIRLKFAMLV